MELPVEKEAGPVKAHVFHSQSTGAKAKVSPGSILKWGAEGEKVKSEAGECWPIILLCSYCSVRVCESLCLCGLWREEESLWTSVHTQRHWEKRRKQQELMSRERTYSTNTWLYCQTILLFFIVNTPEGRIADMIIIIFYLSIFTHVNVMDCPDPLVLYQKIAEGREEGVTGVWSHRVQIVRQNKLWQQQRNV